MKLQNIRPMGQKAIQGMDRGDRRDVRNASSLCTGTLVPVRGYALRQRFFGDDCLNGREQIPIRYGLSPIHAYVILIPDCPVHGDGEKLQIQYLASLSELREDLHDKNRPEEGIQTPILRFL